MSVRSYQVRTYGCQMNVHDSERLSGLLEDAGYVRAGDGEQRRRRRLQHLRRPRERRQQALRQPRPPGAGEDGQPGHADRRRRLPRAEGPRRDHPPRARGSTSSSAPTTSARCRCCSSAPRHNQAAQVEILESLEVFPSTLPTRRESPYAAWVSISVGCNNTCTFCIVPALRGTEKDRRPGDVLAEVEALVAEGVLEVTLLGQNVNSYGVEFGDRLAFGKLLRACGAVDGLERVRFTSPAPQGLHRRRDRRDGRDAERHALAAHAAAVRLGPDAARRCAGRTGRSATSASSTGSAPRCRTPRSPPTSSSASRARPRTTSRRRCDVVREARFAGAFTFQYSKRPGTPAADAARPGAEGGRAGALRAAARAAGGDLLGGEHAARSAAVLEVLVAEGEGRKDGATAPAVRPRAATTGWCTSRCRRTPGAPARATSRPSR